MTGITFCEVRAEKAYNRASSENMRHTREWAITIAAVLAAGACTRPPAPAPAASSDGAIRRLRADVTFLADDALEGRGTPGRGLDLAALYLENQLRAAGVQPVAGESYRQSYRIGEYKPADAKVRIEIDGKALAPADYVLVNIGRDPALGPLEADLVYGGNGVVAEERSTDDLTALDLRGKALLVSKGAPWQLDAAQVFGPDRAIGKVMAATVRGAPLLVYASRELDIGNEAEAGFLHEMRNAPVAFFREQGLGPASVLSPILAVKPEALARALGADLDKLGRGPTGKRIRLGIEAPVAVGTASNVLGKIPGADPALREEWVVLSAHYDHIGSHDVPQGQDGIWNGADDNASGTAAVLEIARRLAATASKRSVLVFFTSGEDRGIFGSALYAARPVAPMEKVIAQINLDMVGRSQGKVEAIAPCAPGMFEEAVRLGNANRIEVLPDQQPTWRLMYLTDTYHFARFGVPGVEFFTGFHPDYHQPSDTADKIRYDELARIVDLAAAVARGYRDGNPKPAFTRPAWFRTPD